MYKNDFKKQCKERKILEVIPDQDGDGFKLVFDNMSVNVSIEDDMDEDCDGDLVVIGSKYKYETDEEKEIRLKNTIKIYDSEGRLTPEYNNFVAEQVKSLTAKYGGESFKIAMELLQSQTTK